MELQVSVFNSTLKIFYTHTSGAPARELRLSLHEAHRRSPRGCSGPARRARRGPAILDQSTSSPCRSGLSNRGGKLNQEFRRRAAAEAVCPGPWAGGEGREVETQPGIAPIATAAPHTGTLPQTPQTRHDRFFPLPPKQMKLW